MSQDNPSLVETDLARIEAQVAAQRYDLLTEWQNIAGSVAEAKKVIAREMALRKQVFSAFFPAAKEGTNTADLPEGWKLKGVYKLDRKVEVATLDATLQQLRTMGIRTDDLIRYKPEVAIKEMKALSSEALAIFSSAIITKEAAPDLSLVPPKEK